MGIVGPKLLGKMDRWPRTQERMERRSTRGRPFRSDMSLSSRPPHLPMHRLSAIVLLAMFEDFTATDRWAKKPVHCVYQALIVAIATRHADAVDIKFLVSGRIV